MNDLENEAKPFLTPMIQGRGRHLHPHGQAVVAAWAVKMALALHLTTPEKAAMPVHYREITETHRAPRQTWVWLAAYTGWRAAYHHSSQLRLDSSTHSAAGYATTLAIGHLVFQVFGYSGIEDGVTIARRTWARATQTIHPFEGSIVWPSSTVLDEQGLMALSTAFETTP
jgi:hypothetical protein